MRPKLLAFFADFAPLAVYYGAEAIWGEETALLLSIAWVGGETAWKLLRRQPFTLFFVLTSVLTILFGAADLYFRGDLLRYEPVALNLLLGVCFLSARFVGSRLLREMAETQGRVLPPFDPRKAKYFRALILVWAAYFGVKALAYFLLASRLDREQILAVRFFLGNGSVVLLAALSVFGLRIVGKRGRKIN